LQPDGGRVLTRRTGRAGLLRCATAACLERDPARAWAEWPRQPLWGVAASAPPRVVRRISAAACGVEDALSARALNNDAACPWTPLQDQMCIRRDLDLKSRREDLNMKCSLYLPVDSDTLQVERCCIYMSSAHSPAACSSC